MNKIYLQNNFNTQQYLQTYNREKSTLSACRTWLTETETTQGIKQDLRFIATLGSMSL